MVDRRVGAVFALVALLAPLGAVLVPPRGSLAALSGGTVLALLAIASTVLAQRRQASVLGAVGPLLYLVAVGLLRHAEGGSSSGYSPLLLLPLFWVALTSDSRRVLWAVVAGVSLTLIVPILLFGDPDYPIGEWSRATIWLAVAPTVGFATQQLVAEIRAASAAMEGLARTDPLTGLLNRRGFQEIADREVIRARRTGEPLVVALLDLDHFKRFNDTRGHQAGDDLLAAAARSWTRELREVDVLARWGGEEFVILLPRCPDQVALNVLERVRSGTPQEQTCSVGYAEWRAGETLDDLTARADVALYEAKEAGRNRVMRSRPAEAR